LSFVLEHVRDPQAMLADARRLASFGDHLFVEVPNIETFKGWPLDEYFHVAHLNYFSPATLTALLRRTGWNVVKIQAVGNYSVAALASAAPADAPHPATYPFAAREVALTVTRIQRRRQREAVGRMTRAVLKPGIRVARGAIRPLLGPDIVELGLQRLRGVFTRIVRS
jgi:Methyltransferase domain